MGRFDLLEVTAMGRFDLIEVTTWAGLSVFVHLIHFSGVIQLLLECITDCSLNFKFICFVLYNATFFISRKFIQCYVFISRKFI
jgi:hypothetical protein